MVSDSDDLFIAGFMADYFAECDEHLTAVRGQLLSLERAVGQPSIDPIVLEELFRSFHSIKGISGMVELREAEMLAHEMESYLRALRQRHTVVSQAGVDALIAGVSALDAVLSARREKRASPAVGMVMRQIAAVVPEVIAPDGAPSSSPPSGAAAQWLVTFVPSAELNARGVNVDNVRARLRERGTIAHATPKILASGIAFEFGFAGELDAATREAWLADGVTAEPATAPVAPAGLGPSDDDPAGSLSVAEETSRPSSVSHYVRVDLSKLDELMRMIGDLVISRARLEDTLTRIEPRVPAVEWRAVHEDSAVLERQLRDLREGVVRVRLVPVGEIFRRMPFVVRDLAKESGARVRLVLQGQETEIDKYVIERMMDPVLHLVRNSVTHAFESPEERRASNKPEEGTLRLTAGSAGESVIIEIADDGRGIDAEDVVRRARLLGISVPEGAASAATLLDLICTPGFSTRDETDRGSGRGVGMAVVKSTIQQLNGTLSLHTEPRVGTRFTIELPLTLSITEAMIATVGDRTFAVPQGSVREVIEIEPATLRTVEEHEIVPYRGGALPIVRLARVFGIAERPRRSLHAFVIGSGLEAVGVVVDRISGQREIVVRTISDAMIKVDGVAGATDLGDGRVVLILNLAALARRARRVPGAPALGRTRSA
jgi:two-component system, chemotaxis family, sensor kinase CheA